VTRACDFRTLASITVSNSCHPERSLAQSEAKRQTQSKDLVSAGATEDCEENFHIVIRFFDEHHNETLPFSATK
jgi:hypothetical protein